MSCFSLAILLQALFLATAFLVPVRQSACALRDRPTTSSSSAHQQAQWRFERPLSHRLSALPSGISSSGSSNSEQTMNLEQNSVFIEGLIDNLQGLLDKYILSGSPKKREQAFNVLDQIAAQAMDEELAKKAIRMAQRAGVPMEKTYIEKFNKELGKTDAAQRRKDAEERKRWEEAHQTTGETGANVANNLGGKSALSRRMAGTSSSRPDLMMSSVLDPDKIATVYHDKTELQRDMLNSGREALDKDGFESREPESIAAASLKVSELVARAGAGSNFDGEALGIGGLNDVLSQVKRRIWIPLAAPPTLLKELGIHPVRGLLLYGKPGCGKTLLARTLGSILSPLRPITVVSGPEIMDKFVGSSEKNLREIFDNPPDIYEKHRVAEADGGDAIARVALHVIVMDEFDAVARARGGRDGKGGQGDAGVARDSVVNQLLAKMDGVNPLPVPTLVIGLTNKRSLIEPALLRPGRFEVQLEVPPPRTIEQRMGILSIHTKGMYEAGRVLVSDPPSGTAADRYLKRDAGWVGLVPYQEFLMDVAKECEGFSGAALAGVARAAASHALERAVTEFSRHIASDDGSTASASDLADCLVTRADFNEAVADVRDSMGSSDHSDDDEASNATNGVELKVDTAESDAP